jgi:hypothetical protein
LCNNSELLAGSKEHKFTRSLRSVEKDFHLVSMRSFVPLAGVVRAPPTSLTKQNQALLPNFSKN